MRRSLLCCLPVPPDFSCVARSRLPGLRCASITHGKAGVGLAGRGAAWTGAGRQGADRRGEAWISTAGMVLNAGSSPARRVSSV